MSEFELPDLPGAVRVEMTVSTLLTIAKLLSGAGFGIGAAVTAIAPERLSAYVTLGIFALSIAGAVASWMGTKWQHYRMIKDKRDSEVSAAVASAEISAARGVPTPVIVQTTPLDQPNTVVQVPASRLISATIAGKMAPIAAAVRVGEG